MRKTPLLPLYLSLALSAAALLHIRSPLKERHSQSSIAVGAPSARAVENYGKLPLSFEINQGQTDSQVKFISRGSGYSLFLTSNEAVLSLPKPEGSASVPLAHWAAGTAALRHNLEATAGRERDGSLVSKTERPHEAVVRMKLVGANPSPQV